MSNNGINSATNGRTHSANNTSSSHASSLNQTIPTHVTTIIKSNAVNNISVSGNSGSSHVANKMSINNKTNDNRNAKIPNAVTATNATNSGAVAAAATSHKSNNNDQYSHQQQQQQHPPPINPRKLSATPSATAANSSTSASSCASNIAVNVTTTSRETTSQPHVNVNVNRLPTHRRDSSNVSGHHTAHGTGGILSQSLKDASKYRYIRPQTVFRKEEPPNRDEVDKVISSSSPPIDKRVCHLQEEARKAGDSNHELLVYYDGQLEGGSLEALIEHMVPTYNYYPERNYIFSFLLSARLFVRPHELLAKISHTWERQQQQQLQQSGTVAPGMQAIHDQLQDDAGHFPQTNTNSPLMLRKQSLAGAPSTNIQKSAQNCIRLLAEWIETFPYDFRDERLMQQVRILTRKCVYIDNSLGKQVSKILQLLVQRLTALEKYEEFLQSLQQYDLNNALHPHYSTSASASYSSSSSSTCSSNHGANNSLTKSSLQALNSHMDLSHKNNFLSNAQFHSASQPAASSSSSNSTSGSTALGSDSPNAHDVFGIMDLCPSCAQLAHQLTAIELDRLSHIGPEEFVQAFAKEYQNSISNSSASSASGGGRGSSSGGGGGSSESGQVMSTSLNDMKKTRNLESYVEWFNRLSYLTASEIVKYPKKKQRVRVIEYWIETARECFNIGNFNSLMAIIAGLNLAPISRLKKTWSKVQLAKFSVLEHQMDPTSNFNSYRSTLKAAMWRSEGATEERERIIIPFFSLFVKDLYFLNEGCSNRLPNNHINFEKCSQLAKQVMEFNEWKQVSCPFERLPNVIAYLQNIAILNENTLSIASFECEPPENHEEKDRYKTVKAETKQQLLQQLQEQQLQQQQQHQQHQHLHTH